MVWYGMVWYGMEWNACPVRNNNKIRSQTEKVVEVQ